MKKTNTVNIFLSYRRSDTGDLVGRISDTISKYIPRANIFMDVETLAGGVDFKQQIEQSVTSADIVLVLIGSGWAGNDNNHNRMLDEDDFVRLEVAQSLKATARVYPILINDAQMPAASELPEEMQSICSLNALEVRHSRYADDMKHCLKDIFGLQESHFSGATLFDKGKAVLTGLITAAVILVLLAIVHDVLTGKALSTSLGKELTTLLILATPIISIGYFWRRWIN